MTELSLTRIANFCQLDKFTRTREGERLAAGPFAGGMEMSDHDRTVIQDLLDHLMDINQGFSALESIVNDWRGRKLDRHPLV